MPPTFPIARLNRYTPNFSGVPQKLTWCQQFGFGIFPKWGDAHILPKKNAVFRCFFLLNKFSQPNGRLLPIASHSNLESYGTQLWFGLSGNHFSASYKASDFCWQNRLEFLEHLTMSHILVELTNTEKWVFVNVTNICTNIKTAVLSSLRKQDSSSHICFMSRPGNSLALTHS